MEFVIIIGVIALVIIGAIVCHLQAKKRREAHLRLDQPGGEQQAVALTGFFRFIEPSSRRRFLNLGP